MSQDVSLVLEAFRLGDEARAARILREYLEKKMYALVFEDHERVMTSDQMEKHIEMLHGKSEDKTAFLNKLAHYSDLDACSEKDFRKCAENIQGKGKVFMDKAIHALEKLIGYKFDPKKVDENFGNLITRAVAGVPDGGAKISNVYTTKNIPKKKKKLPSLKKNVYGTGLAPGAWHGDGDSDGGDSGGGDGGGGGE